MIRRLVDAWNRVRPLWLLVASGVLTVMYGFPGRLDFDGAAQLGQARANHYEDWHPPVMARYWRVLDQLVAGPLLMLLLQTALFLWGAYGIARRRFSARTSALIAGILLLFPPVLTIMAGVWKDTQMAGFLLAGLHLMLGAGWRRRSAGIAMFVLAAAVRDNAVTALPGLLLVVVAVWTPAARWKRVALAAGLTLAIFGVAVVANVALTDKRSYAWFHTTAIYDIAGTLCHAEPLTDDEVRSELAGMELRQSKELWKSLCAAYNPVNWIPLVYGDAAPLVDTAEPAERDARRAAFFRVIREHPGAYFRHRVQVMQLNLGLAGVTPMEPVPLMAGGTQAQIAALKLGAQTSKFQRVIGRKLEKLAYTNKILFRPWVYVLLGLVLFGYAAVRRDGMLAGITTSGLLYEAGYFFAAPGAGYRYQHWMIVCVVFALLIVFVERWREGRAATA
ncbi:MAG TPA: hypothetical protein VIV58_34885 [Kofleriaceae bacterium]